MSLDVINLASAMREAETGLIVLDAMIRRDGYTQEAKDSMAELHALIKQVRMLAENVEGDAA